MRTTRSPDAPERGDGRAGPAPRRREWRVGAGASVAAMSALAVLGCVGVTRLSPDLAGCYAVVAKEWTPAHARATGLRALPRHVALDTVRGHRILIPQAWRLADPPNYNGARLDVERTDWAWVDDRPTQVPSPTELHRLPSDSIGITFAGWRGRVEAYLALEGEDFVGLGVVTSALTRDQEVLPLRLERTVTCPGDLTESGAPLWPQ